jgi:hypothetical protein
VKRSLSGIVYAVMHDVSVETEPRTRSRRGRPTRDEYVRRVRGPKQGEVARWLPTVLGASNPTRFWHYWNPIYGYYLLYFVYRPARRFVPRPPALLLTFVVCGFVAHDLLVWAIAGQPRFPIFAVLFTIFGLEIVLTEVLGFDLSRRPFAARAVANVAFIAVAVAGAGLVERFV